MITLELNKFEEAWAQLVAEKKPAIMLFSSTQDKEGKYWCPDCQAILPLYEEMVGEAEAHKLPFYTFIAGDRDTWKNPDHIFRKMP